MRSPALPGETPLFWVGSAKRDLLEFPDPVIDAIGSALSVAQFGGRHHATKLWKGEGSGVVEIVEDFDRATYRVVYVVRFKSAIYVLHCFQKKSTSGIATSRRDIELISKRLHDAREHYEASHGKVQS